MAEHAALASLSGGNDGFFSSISEGISEGISKIGSDVLPVWAANQLKVQSNDQLAAPTFNPGAAPPRNNDALRTTTGVAVTGSSGGVPNAVWFVAGAVGLVMLGAVFLRGR